MKTKSHLSNLPSVIINLLVAVGILLLPYSLGLIVGAPLVWSVVMFDMAFALCMGLCISVISARRSVWLIIIGGLLYIYFSRDLVGIVMFFRGNLFCNSIGGPVCSQSDFILDLVIGYSLTLVVVILPALLWKIFTSKKNKMKSQADIP